jgi:hypothetical protein
VASPSPTQIVWRGRIEAGLRLAAPLLDVLLAVGERVSKVAERDAVEPAPPVRRVPARNVKGAVGPGAG